MNTDAALGKVSPGITAMIRADHTHVMALFHKYRTSSGGGKKRAIVDAVCLAVEIHAQLEEEIFYPALEAAMTEDRTLDKARPEHDEIKQLIGELRTMDPEAPAFDERFMELMRAVMHHVADEETVLLPAAERLLADQLGVLGARMTRRRMQLAAPHAGRIAASHARAMPATTMLMAGGLLAGGYLLGKALEHRRH